MSSITRFLLNLSIGAKLGIASGLGVLLVATMVIVQIRSNAAMRDLDARMAGQQTIARDAVDAKASIGGMQTAVRDLRLANNPADLQKATDTLAARLKSTTHLSDEMLKLSKSAENRARIEKLKTRAEDYSKVTLPIAAELAPLADQIAEFAKHGVDEQAAQAACEMATAERESMAIGLGT